MGNEKFQLTLYSSMWVLGRTWLAPDLSGLTNGGN
jgi:hypothetical protein